MKLKDIGRKAVDSISLAQDKVQWLAFVSTVLNLRVLQNTGNILSSWATISVSKGLGCRKVLTWALQLRCERLCGVNANCIERDLPSAWVRACVLPELHTQTRAFLPAAFTFVTNISYARVNKLWWDLALPYRLARNQYTPQPGQPTHSLCDVARPLFQVAHISNIFYRLVLINPLKTEFLLRSTRI
jgi:hypothetical protein